MSGDDEMYIPGDVRAGDVVRVIGSHVIDNEYGAKLIGTAIDPWLQEDHIESIWWNVLLADGKIINWPVSQLRVISRV